MSILTQATAERKKYGALYEAEIGHGMRLSFGAICDALDDLIASLGQPEPNAGLSDDEVYEKQHRLTAHELGVGRFS